MLLSDFDYDLPPELIAQRPADKRDSSRMLLLDRERGGVRDAAFADLPAVLRGNELIIVNNARVIPARLFGRRLGIHADPAGKHTGSGSEFLSARIEVLLVRRLEDDRWEALVKPGRKVRSGERIVFAGEELQAEVAGRGGFGLRILRFFSDGDVLEAINRIGHIPLPPYIRRTDDSADRERYQTVFAAQPGAVAAPTAGLHFTPAVVDRVRAAGAELREITLDVGLGTFQPIHAENVEEHRIHSESYDIPEDVASAITAARRDHRPILAVGTTVVRALEDAAAKAKYRASRASEILPGRATADIYIRPGHEFALVDQMLTNFHLPRSTLLVLVAAFAGREKTLAAYGHAVSSAYRFYSYGDCMLIR